LAEPSAGLLPPDWCDEFSSQYVKRLVDAVQDEGFFIVLHNCGYVTKLVNSMVHFLSLLYLVLIKNQYIKDRGKISLGPLYVKHKYNSPLLVNLSV